MIAALPPESLGVGIGLVAVVVIIFAATACDQPDTPDLPSVGTESGTRALPAKGLDSRRSAHPSLYSTHQIVRVWQQPGGSWSYQCSCRAPVVRDLPSRQAVDAAMRLHQGLERALDLSVKRSVAEGRLR